MAACPDRGFFGELRSNPLFLMTKIFICPYNFLNFYSSKDSLYQFLGSGSISGSFADPGCLSRIQDPGFNFFHSGCRVDKIPDPGSGSASSILTQKTETKFSKIRSGMFIPDPGSGFFSIPDPGAKKATDSGPGSATLITRKAKLTPEKGK
jgi:hypothetical protein